MAGKHSRDKGSSGERELAAAIYDELGVRLLRRLEQTRSGGCDLAVHPDETGPVAAQIARYALEVKRHTKALPAQVRSWWAQAAAQAAASGRVPCLAFRADREPWHFVLPLQAIHPDMPAPVADALDYCAVLTLRGFAALMREGSPR